MSGTEPYYMQAFSPLPDRCYCLVSGGEGGRPDPLPGAIDLARPLPHPNGRRYTVEACEGHRPARPVAPQE
jgi:hypothetical protein